MLEILLRVNGDVHERATPPLRGISERENLAVANKPQRPVKRAHLRDADPDFLDSARDLLDGDDVADAELILKHHEDAVQDILHDVLSAEREPRRDDTRRGEHRAEIDLQAAEDQDQRDDRNGPRNDCPPD